MSALRTARLVLRPVCLDDVDGLHAVFTDPDVRRYLLDGHIVSRTWVAYEVDASVARFAEGVGGIWATRMIDEAPIVGFAGYRHFFDPPELQLLYGLLPSRWGRGLAVESARAVIRHGFGSLGMTEIRAATDAPNTASVRVLERLGFLAVPCPTGAPPGTMCFRLVRGD